MKLNEIALRILIKTIPSKSSWIAHVPSGRSTWLTVTAHRNQAQKSDGAGLSIARFLNVKLYCQKTFILPYITATYLEPQVGREEQHAGAQDVQVLLPYPWHLLEREKRHMDSRNLLHDGYERDDLLLFCFCFVIVVVAFYESCWYWKRDVYDVMYIVKYCSGYLKAFTYAESYRFLGRTPRYRVIRHSHFLQNDNSY